MSKKTIKLKKYVDVNVEYKANAALSPGHLIELHTTGKVRKHETAGGAVLPMFALEDELRGKTIDDAFSTDDLVQCWIPTRGDVVNARLAHGQNISIGGKLMSNGDGTLKAYSSEEDSAGDYDIQKNIIVGIALEAVNISSSGLYTTTGDSGAWIKVLII